MAKQFSPMLAPPESPLKNPRYFEEIRYPLLASPKLDGIRCIVKQPVLSEANSDLEIVHSGLGPYTCLSRKLLALPSAQVQSLFSQFEEMDGEMIVGNETDFDVYNRTQSHVMSDDKPSEDIRFRVFDCADEEFAGSPFKERLEYVSDQIKYINMQSGVNVSLVEHVLCRTKNDILEYEEWALNEGYEGVMLRDPNGTYKHGRGTFLQGLIYKLKREQDDEFQIVGFREAKTNTNAKVTDETGHAKRSTAAAGLIGANTLGKILVMFNGIEIEVACGSLTHAQRKDIWDNQAKYLGLWIMVRHFGHGAKDLLRFPRFVGFRDLRFM